MNVKTAISNAVSLTKRRTTTDIVKGFTSGISDLFAHAEAQRQKVRQIDDQITVLEVEADEREADADRAQRIAAKLEAIFA